MVDKSIISQCIAKDRKAYEKLYNQTLPYMIVLCRRYNVADSDMEDTLQDIYSEVFISLHNYDESKGDFKPWFRKVGLYRILKSYRRKGAQIVDIESYSEDFIEDEEAVDVYKDHDIFALVESLPEGYKTVFNLAQDGFDHGEISSVLGITKSASRSQLARAKKILRNQILSLKM